MAEIRIEGKIIPGDPSDQFCHAYLVFVDDNAGCGDMA